MTDEELKRIIAREMAAIFNRIHKQAPANEDYVNYMIFCISGYMLRQGCGPTRFNEVVEEIIRIADEDNETLQPQ